jgi:hypothetical protein
MAAPSNALREAKEQLRNAAALLHDAAAALEEVDSGTISQLQRHSVMQEAIVARQCYMRALSFFCRRMHPEHGQQYSAQAFQKLLGSNTAFKIKFEAMLMTYGTTLEEWVICNRIRVKANQLLHPALTVRPNASGMAMFATPLLDDPAAHLQLDVPPEIQQAALDALANLCKVLPADA